MNKVYLARIIFDSETTGGKTKIDTANVVINKEPMTQEMFSAWLEKEMLKDYELKDFDFENSCIKYSLKEYLNEYSEVIADKYTEGNEYQEHTIQVIMIDDKIYEL
jgi:hypothetical protein